MKNLKLLYLSFSLVFFCTSNLFAQLQTLVDYGNQSFVAGSQLNTRMMVTKLTLPTGIGFDVREIGVQMHSSSLAGTIRFGFYDLNGLFLAQTPELTVNGGSEYVSFDIEPGSLEMPAGSTLQVGIMTSSSDVKYGIYNPGANMPTNAGCSSVYGFLYRMGSLTYPTVPSDIVNWEAQVGGVIALVVKASPLPMDNLIINEGSGIENDGAICPGTNVSLTSPIVTTGLSWNTNSTSAAINVSPTVNTTYTLTLTRGSCFVSKSQEITILPDIVATLTVSDTSGVENNDGIICSGTNVQFIATYNADYTYQWGTSETSNILTLQDVPVGFAGLYVLYIRNSDGCEKEFLKTLIVNESPNGSLTQTNPACVGENGNVNFVVSGGTPNYTVQWSNGDILPPSNQTTYSNSLPAGDYLVGVNDANFCYDVDTFTIVDPSPVNASTSVSDFTISANATGATYLWINCANNQAIAGASSQSYTATANGEYAVIVTQNGCSDTSACTTISTIGVDELKASFKLYPNPATSTLTIASSQTIDQIMITDLSGKVISITTEKGMNQTIDVSELNRGMYLVKVSSQGNQITKQFVKE